MCLQLASARSTISRAVFESLLCKCDQYLGFLRSLDGQSDRLDTDFTNLLANARDSRSTLLHGAGSPFHEFHVLVTEDGISEDDPLPPLTD